MVTFLPGVMNYVRVSQTRSELLRIFWLLIFLISPSFLQANVIFNDVSGLNPTSVQEIVQPTSIEEIRDKVLEASRLNLKISIAGKRHSQGGQQSCNNCIVLDMLNFNKIISLDVKDHIIRVQSGATWDQIQRYINPYNFSLKVMQTSNIFTVGGSLSANVHGQDIRYGDLRSTIKSFQLLLADGNIVNVSRKENADLFDLTIGGLGLFGVILEVEIELTNNDVYKQKVEILNYKDYVDNYKKFILPDPDAQFHFAMLSIAPGKDFLKEMIVTTYTKDKEKLNNWDLREEENISRDKFLLGLSRKYSWGKSLRWYLQKLFKDGSVKDKVISRNNVMRNPIKFLEYASSKDTDILQEYFVPLDQFVSFIDGLKRIVQQNDINLLYVGIRHVLADQEGYISYAQEDSIAVVLYVNQAISEEGKSQARLWTQQLVDLAIECKGKYYLVYQLYPTREQLHKTYPKIDELFKMKRFYDSQERFINQFYTVYSKE